MDNWESLIAEAYLDHTEGTHPSLKAAARAVARASGRGVETCYTALRRYDVGKRICTRRSPCDRCAAIRKILSNQKSH